MLTLIKAPKTLKIMDLKNLGYRLSGKQVGLGPKPHRYGILEVFNEDNKKEVSFSLLFSSKTMAGVILPQPFHHYELIQIYDVNHFLREAGVI
jgi:hypothetical protein